MWELDHKESWASKNWYFWTVVLEKTLESPLDCKEVQPLHPKGNQSWVFIGRTDDEAEAPILWQPDVKNWVIGKDPDAGKDWRQEEKGTTEDEMVGWHHWLDGHKFEQTPEAGDGQGSLACYSPWGCSIGHDWATELNWASLDISQYSTQLCLTLCNPMDCSPPGSSVHEISQEEYWVVFHFLLQGILLTQEWKLHLLRLLHWQMDSLSFVSPGKPSLDIGEMQITSTCLAEWLKLVNNIEQMLMRLWGEGNS